MSEIVAFQNTGNGGRIPVSTAQPLPVTSTPSGTAPVGGGITWTKSAVTMTGASATLLAANAARKGMMVSNPASNAVAGIDITGGTASLTSGLVLQPGTSIALTGADCPVGLMTQFGTNAQLLTLYEGT